MAYDELYDRSELRPIYRRHFQKFFQLTSTQKNEVLRKARASVNRDADFLPLVRLLSKPEYEALTAGVKQRGRALQMFLHDHYFGKRTYEKAGVLSSALVQKIKNRYSALPRGFALRPEHLQFWYAPDIIRDETGAFRVIEDNIGFTGGFGDLEAFAKASRILGAPAFVRRNPRAFYRAMVKSYRREARVYGGGKIVLLSYPKSEQLNHEDERLSRILEDEGVATVTNLRTLKVRGEGLFHHGERVGFVIMNINVDDIDPVKPTSYRVSNFWDALSKGQFGVSYAPGLEFVSDKEFCPYVEALIGHYLNEPCLLPSLPVFSLEKPLVRRKVRKQQKEWVVKSGRGQSGKAVWVGPFVSVRAWAQLFKRIEKRPGDFIAQSYVEPSQLLGHAVDLRPLAVVSPKDVRVSPIPWGRAARRKTAKTNIARGGLLSAVAIVSKFKLR